MVCLLLFQEKSPNAHLSDLESDRHTLTNAEKSAYINAELCLMKKPATLGLRGAKTRFDELQAIHQLQAYSTHFVVGLRQPV